jgi:hypothetical protein
VCLSFALILSACGLLKTRDPESPETTNAANPPAFDPATVIANLALAFGNKNVTDYAKLFADTASVGRPFVFIPTQKAAATYAGFFSHWTIDAETNYFRKAVSSVSPAFSPDVVFYQSVTTKYHEDSSSYEADYRVFIAPNTYLGHARMYLIPDKNTGIWSIYRWEDFPSTQNPDTTSWSDLKGQFSQ